MHTVNLYFFSLVFCIYLIENEENNQNGIKRLIFKFKKPSVFFEP
jgi:hypothetical protein